MREDKFFGKEQQPRYSCTDPSKKPSLLLMFCFKKTKKLRQYKKHFAKPVTCFLVCRKIQCRILKYIVSTKYVNSYFDFFIFIVLFR